jgi:hypothetical protein
METETLTPTPTYTPTDTPTPTPTFTPTPNFYVEMVTAEGNPARLVREASVADMAIILLLVALLVSIWVMYIQNRLRR